MVEAHGRGKGGRGGAGVLVALSGGWNGKGWSSHSLSFLNVKCAPQADTFECLVPSWSLCLEKPCRL